MLPWRTSPSRSVINERVKLVATTLDTVALTLFGVAIVRPFVEQGASSFDLDTLYYLGLGVAFHIAAHHVLGRLKEKDETHDRP